MHCVCEKGRTACARRACRTCPEQSMTSPKTTSTSSTTPDALLAVTVTPVTCACCGGSTTFHMPFASAVAFKSVPEPPIVTLTSAPGSSQPQMGAGRFLCVQRVGQVRKEVGQDSRLGTASMRGHTQAGHTYPRTRACTAVYICIWHAYVAIFHVQARRVCLREPGKGHWHNHLKHHVASKHVAESDRRRGHH
jgi:hypothetical protein